MRCIAHAAGVLLLLALPPARVTALDPAKTIPQYKHGVWGREQGLEGFSINACLESGDGYYWIATDDGLFRFDGVRFTLYSRATTPVMTGDDVACLAETRDGAVWFGTRGGGLYRLRGDTLSRFGAREGLGGEYVLALHVDREGALWIGMQEYGVARLEPGGFKRYRLKVDHGLNAGQAFYERPDGTLFFAYASVFEYWRGYDTFREVLQNRKFVLSMIDDDGFLLAATDGGLVVVDSGSARNRPALCGITAGKFVRSLLRDRDGNLWIGTEGDGLLRYAAGRVSSYTTRNGLSSDRILSLYEDRRGSLWITTRGGGLNRLSDTRIAVYGKSEGLTGDIISTVFEDHRGTWWVGTRGNGLNMLRNGVVVGHLSVGSGLSDSVIRAVTESPPGTIWVGTREGMNRLVLDSRGNVAAIRRYLTLPSPNNHVPTVRALSTARDGTVLVGEYGDGVFRVDGNSLKHLPRYAPRVLGDGTVHVVFEDAAGTVWSGTHAGLYGVHGDSVSRYAEEQGLTNTLVYALTEDREHALWIGTYGGGLFRLKEGKITSVSKTKGLFDDVIFAIVDDSMGSYWMSCNRGIFRVAKRDLDAVADGRMASVSCEVFGLEEGLRSAECNGGTQPAAVRTHDGHLLFPTMEGLVVIDPARRTADQPVALPRIEEVVVDTLRLNPSAEHGLPPGSRTFGFRYTALGAADPAKVQFRYRLNGFDDRMVDAGIVRRIRYTNVPPGVYTFSVMARVPGGTWSAPVTSAPITVPPYMYERWWASVLAALALVGAAGMAFRYLAGRKARQRIEQLERDHALERERARIARDMHDEIGASLTQITILSELLERNLRAPETAEPFVRKISSTAREVVASLDEIVWFVNPRHDSLESLLLYIREYAADYLDTIDIRCAFAFPDAVPSLVLAADVRRNIFLAVKEAVTNIVKHSGATAASVSASVAGGALRIEIADNGRGFRAPAGLGTEDGLRNIEKRLRDIGGDVVVAGNDGTGTRITLTAAV